MLRQVKPQVPGGLPPARLYLDDIEKIIQIFVEAENEREEEARLPDQNEQAETTFQVFDQTGVDLQDLSKIHPKSTHDFFVEVRKGVGFNACVSIARSHTHWYAFGLTDNERWGTFHKLEAVFEARKLSWKKLLHTHSRVSYWLYGATSVLLLVLLPIPFIKRLPHTPAIALLAVVAILFIALRTGLGTHSIVILRHHSEHATLFQEKAWKIIPAVLAWALGLITGLLVPVLKKLLGP